MQVSFTAPEIYEIVRPVRTEGATTTTIQGIAALASATPEDLSFLGNTKYRAEVPRSRAAIILVPPDYKGNPGPNQIYHWVDNPSEALARICARIEQSLWPKPLPGIHSSAVVDASAVVPASVTIGPFCIVEAGAVLGERTHLQAHVFVGRNARIGADCWLMPGVVLATECLVGNRVRVEPGAVIGADGFGYDFHRGRHERVPQVGTVEIGDDVDIGANTTIDRARFSRTLIGEGTKIDNLVMIAHNVVVGRHCLICSQVGIAGSTTLEDYVVLGGQAGLAGHITIGKGVKAGGQTGIGFDTPPGQVLNGSPALPLQLERRLFVLHQRLPELFKRVSALEDSADKTK